MRNLMYMVNLGFCARCLGLVAFISFFAACAPLKPQQIWQVKPLPLATIKRPLVLLMLKDAALRKQQEAYWALTLRDKKIHATPSYAALMPLPSINQASLNTLKQLKQIDGLIVASVTLDKLPFAQALDIDSYLKHRLNLGFDIFVQNVETALVEVAAFSIDSGRILWKSNYQVDVQANQMQWSNIIDAANDALLAAGLTPIPPASNAPASTAPKKAAAKKP